MKEVWLFVLFLQNCLLLDHAQDLAEIQTLYSFWSYIIIIWVLLSWFQIPILHLDTRLNSYAWTCPSQLFANIVAYVMFRIITIKIAFYMYSGVHVWNFCLFLVTMFLTKSWRNKYTSLLQFAK